MELITKMSTYFRDEDLQQIQAVCADNGIDIATVKNFSALVLQMVGKIETPGIQEDKDWKLLGEDLQTAKATIATLNAENETLRNSNAQTIDTQEYNDLKTRFETLQADYNLIESQVKTIVTVDDTELQTLKAENAKLKSEIVQFSGMVHDESKSNNPTKPGNWFNDIFK